MKAKQLKDFGIVLSVDMPSPVQQENIIDMIIRVLGVRIRGGILLRPAQFFSPIT